MTTVVEKVRQGEYTKRKPPLRHILDEKTGMSVCGLARPKPDTVYRMLHEVDRREICVVCLELSGARV